MRAIVILTISFFSEVIAGGLNFIEVNLWSFILALLSFIFSYGIMAFILFNIGVSAVQSNSVDKMQFQVNASEELFTEEELEV